MYKRKQNPQKKKYYERNVHYRVVFSYNTQISLSREKRRNESSLYHLFTIKQLQESYPYLNWLDYIQAFLPVTIELDENETVINCVPTFFEQLNDVLNSTSKRTIANYLLWRAVITASGTSTNEMRKYQFRLSKCQLVQRYT